MVLGIMRLAVNKIKFSKLVGNQLEISWKINWSNTMAHKSNIVMHDETSCKLYEMLEISWKSV